VARLTQIEAAALAAHLVAEFNDAVAACNFSLFLLLFSDDAVIRFENVPGEGTAEYVGRDAYTKAYAERPPDDKVDISGDVRIEDGGVVVPFTWKRDQGPGTIRLRYSEGDADTLDQWLVSAMTVILNPPKAASPEK
jgi:hypothetical protein